MKAPESLPVFEFSAEEMEQAERASKEMARLAADLFGEEQEQIGNNRNH